MTAPEAAPETTDAPDTTTDAPAYPANTAPADMTADQRAAYYKDVADKHEKRSRGNYAILKQLGISNSDDAATVKARLEAAEQLERERETDIEKRERAARESAEQAAAEKYAPMLVRAAFERFVGDRMESKDLNDILDDTNLKNFLSEDGTVDTAKVKARADKIAPPAKGTATPSARGPIVPGHNPQGAPTSKPGAAARAWLQTKHGIKVD